MTPGLVASAPSSDFVLRLLDCSDPRVSALIRG
jgi:hypothetical protein